MPGFIVFILQEREKQANCLPPSKPKKCAQSMLLNRSHLRTQFAKFMLNVALFAAALASGAGCAKIAEPLPPEARIPKPAADLEAFQLADSVVLRVSRPVRNTNGSPVTTLQEVQLLRLTGNRNAGEDGQALSQKQFLEQANPILTIAAPHFSDYLHNEAFVIQDSLPFPQKSMIYSSAFRYAVLFVNNKNQAAGLSNQVRIAPVPIPPAPENLSSEVTETSIRLKWTPPSRNMDGSVPANIAGYNIYRSEEPETSASTPINFNPVQKPEYEDSNFQFDKTYYYRVRTVGSLKNPYAESLPSAIHPVTPRDIFPPNPPENFNAVQEGSSIILLWTPSSSADVAGYKLYRRINGTKTPRLLQNELITALSFRDNTIDPNTNYEYIIQAVDTHGNESTPVRTELHNQ
jgi:hypothetical protein